MDPKEQTRRSLEFDKQPSENIEERPGRIIEETMSGKRLNNPAKQPKNATRQEHPGKPRSGSDSNASRRSRGH
jgi:hypothetical protein